MESDYGRIWDWLIENGRIKAHPPKKRTAAKKPQQITPSHAIDDATLLALEREAEVAAKLRE